MSDRPGSSHLCTLFGAALADYKQQTGMELIEHPLAERLRDCNSIESVAAILREQAQYLKEFGEKDKVFKPLKKILTVLHKLSSAANFVQDVGLHLPPVKAVQIALGILLSAVKGVIDDYSDLADLLESIGHFLNRLEIYTEIPPTEAMNEMVVKILVELLSTLALTTKETKQGKLKKLVGKLVGEKKIEAMVQRLDRLTQDEARQTVAQILKVVHGLVENMKVVMGDGEVSVDHLKETLEIMHQVASDLNKAKRENLQKDIFGWLSPPDPWKNHHAACESCHSGTAEWFLHGNTFQEWKTSQVPGSLLWVHGKPGAGKSVFCSTIIEDIRGMRKAGLASLAFFYCDFRDDRKKDLRGLLSSILVQLYHQSDSYFNTLSKFYSEHDKGSRPPSDDALAGCLKNLLELPGLAPVYLIVDALDECPNPSVVRSPRAKVLSLMEELVKAQIPNLRVCVTSRLELDIKDVLVPLIFRSVSLHDESGQMRDIEDYIKSVINTRTTKRWKEGHRKLAIDVITEKSNGMFRWADCQLVHICDCIPGRIRRALAELPETLDETYERTLRAINKANWEFAHRMFQFVLVASRPLRVKELADLLAFDFEAGSIPKFYEDCRLEDPVEAVLSTCSTLLAIVDDQGFPVIQFSHFSVKEFLTSTRLAKAADIISRRYHVSMTPAHTLVARACLGILLHLDEDITSDSLEDIPLAEYAAEHWVDHALFAEEVSRNVEDGMMQLFDPRKPHLAICVWICNPTVPIWNRMTRNKTPLPLRTTSLHYAAAWGVHPVVEFLIIGNSQNVCSRVTDSKSTPLHIASHFGHAKVACKLVEHGADAKARNRFGETPLHMALQEDRVDVARMLIEHGANTTARNNKGWAPLHIASQKGQVDVALSLIERGADVTARNDNGWTPLHLASLWRQVDVAGVLIERGAGVEVQNNDGWTPLHLASQKGDVDIAHMLIEHGADVTAKNRDRETPLHLASQEGAVDVARVLIECGADVAAKDRDRETPLHRASCRGKIAVACMLIEHGANVAARDMDGETPLHFASCRGLVDVACMLIECGADLTDKNRNYEGWTPLHLALQSGQVDVARIIIERGADVNVRQTRDGESPLHLASRLGQVDVVRALIDHGANITPQNKNYNGWTPLDLALHWRQVEIACVLIECGADLTAQDWNGDTPLHVAIQTRQADIASKLIECGADLSAQDRNGGTPLHVALQVGQADIAGKLIERNVDLTTRDWNWDTPLHVALQTGQVNVASKLIEYGADLTALTNDRQTALHIASQMGQVDLASLLIERGADLTAQDGDGMTPLHWASYSGRVEVARMLIDCGADVAVQDNNGETPLHLTSHWGQTDVARMLIEHGADLDVRKNDGETPLHIASYWGRVDLSRMLIEHGADPEVQNNNGETPLDQAVPPLLRIWNSTERYGEAIDMSICSPERGAE